MATVTYSLLGLHCNACVARVTGQLKPLAQLVAITLDPMEVTLTNPSVDFTALQKAVADALKDPAVKKRMDAQGMYISGTSSADFTKQIASEVAKMKSVAASANISVN